MDNLAQSTLVDGLGLNLTALGKEHTRRIGGGPVCDGVEVSYRYRILARGLCPER